MSESINGPESRQKEEAGERLGELVRGFNLSHTVNVLADFQMINLEDAEGGLRFDSREEQVLNSIDIGEFTDAELEVDKMVDRSRDLDRKPHWVFTGKSFSHWRERIEAVLAREGLKELMWDTAEERRFRTIESKEERYRKMRSYDRKQDRARDIIYKHVDDRHLDRIRDCITAKEMIETLEREHQSRSDVAIISTFNRFDSIRYQRRKDLRAFIDEFEVRAREYRDVGGIINDREIIQRLNRLLPVLYDTVLDYFPALPLHQRTFAIYRELILEKHERTGLMVAENKRVPSVEKCSDATVFGKLSKVEKRDGDNPKKCYICREVGHVTRYCPSVSKSEEKPVGSSQINSSAEKTEVKRNLDSKGKWDQYKAYKKTPEAL